MALDTPLKKEREKQLLESRQVAALLGVSEQYYCEIENGRTPSFKLAWKISKVLKKPIEELFSAHEFNDSLIEQADPPSS